MKKEELFNSLSEEVKKKLAACRTQEEIKRVLAEAGVDPLDDELLDAVAGGYYGGGMQTTAPVVETGLASYV